MVSNKQVFKYQGRVLIEKAFINESCKEKVSFESHGCFLFFKELGGNVLIFDSTLKIKNNEAVLLKSGSFKFDLQKSNKANEIEVIAVHLYPDILKDLYKDELSAPVEIHKYSNISQVIVSQQLIDKFIESVQFYLQYTCLASEDILELKIKELVLLLKQNKNIESVSELL